MLPAAISIPQPDVLFTQKIRQGINLPCLIFGFNAQNIDYYGLPCVASDTVVCLFGISPPSSGESIHSACIGVVLVLGVWRGAGNGDVVRPVIVRLAPPWYVCPGSTLPPLPLRREIKRTCHCDATHCTSAHQWTGTLLPPT